MYLGRLACETSEGKMAYLLGVVTGLSVAVATVLIWLLVAATAAVVIVSRHGILMLFAKTG